VYRLWKR